MGRLYNPGNDLSQGRFVKEVEALARFAHIFGVLEAVKYQRGGPLPAPPSHRVVRDVSNPGRRNIMAFVHKDLPLDSVEWLDLSGTWPRTSGKDKGKPHPPRSMLRLGVGGLVVYVQHQPPRYAPARVRGESWDLLATEVAEDVAAGFPVVVFRDGNDARGARPGSDELAARVGGVRHGGRVDCAVVAGDVSAVGRAEHVTAVGDGVGLTGDHGGAFSARFSVPASAVWGVS